MIERLLAAALVPTWLTVRACHAAVCAALLLLRGGPIRPFPEESP